MLHWEWHNSSLMCHFCKCKSTSLSTGLLGMLSQLNRCIHVFVGKTGGRNVFRFKWFRELRWWWQWKRKWRAVCSILGFDVNSCSRELAKLHTNSDEVLSAIMFNTSPLLLPHRTAVKWVIGCFCYDYNSNNNNNNLSSALYNLWKISLRRSNIIGTECLYTGTLCRILDHYLAVLSSISLKLIHICVITMTAGWFLVDFVIQILLACPRQLLDCCRQRRNTSFACLLSVRCSHRLDDWFNFLMKSSRDRWSGVLYIHQQ